MVELENEYKAKIEEELYHRVLLLVEGEMGKQERLDRLNELSKKQRLTQKEKLSMPNMQEERRKTINVIISLIKDFAQENNIDINDVKEYLLEVLERGIADKDESYKYEHKRAKEIILIEQDDEQR